MSDLEGLTRRLLKKGYPKEKIIKRLIQEYLDFKDNIDSTVEGVQNTVDNVKETVDNVSNTASQIKEGADSVSEMLE